MLQTQLQAQHTFQGGSLDLQAHSTLLTGMHLSAAQVIHAGDLGLVGALAL